MSADVEVKEAHKRELIEWMSAIDPTRVVLAVTCPPGTIPLLFATIAIGVPGLVWLFAVA